VFVNLYFVLTRSFFCQWQV